MENRKQHEVARRLETAAKNIDTPLQRLEHALHPWVTVVVMPIFALANAGLTLGPNVLATITSPVALGVVIGLLAGKPIGILLASWISVRTGVATLPNEVNWRHLIGVGFLAGIGFTMSLFITGLAFPQGDGSVSAKAGILLASAVAGSIGWMMLRRIGSRPA